MQELSNDSVTKLSLETQTFPYNLILPFRMHHGKSLQNCPKDFHNPRPWKIQAKRQYTFFFFFNK